MKTTIHKIFATATVGILAMSVAAACNKIEPETDAPVVAVTGVQLNEAAATMTLGGENMILTATLSPRNATNRTVTWSSDNEAVATVTGGVVAAVSEGETTITVTTTDGKKTATCVVTVSEGGDEPTPEPYFGTVTFLTPTTWTLGNLVWSDVVMATRCKKDDFDGGPDGNPFKVDCRQNTTFNASPGNPDTEIQLGDLFSWQAVSHYGWELCPDGWRVPTRKDFFDLDVALGGGGTGNIGGDLSALWLGYREEWGVQPGGYARTVNPDIVNAGNTACFWAQSGADNNRAFGMYVTYGEIKPQFNETKDLGFTLRCVKDKDFTYSPDNEITLSPGTLSFTGDGGTQTVSVSSRLAWTVAPLDAEWLNVTISDGTLTVTADPNNRTSPRSAIIIVTNGESYYSKAVTVSQEGREISGPAIQFTYAKGWYFQFGSEFELTLATEDLQGGQTLTRDGHKLILGFTDATTNPTPASGRYGLGSPELNITRAIIVVRKNGTGGNTEINVTEITMDIERTGDNYHMEIECISATGDAYRFEYHGTIAFDLL